MCWMECGRPEIKVSQAPVAVVGSMGHLDLYTVRRLDIRCVITRVRGCELTPMHILEQGMWSQNLEDYYWSA